MKYPKYLAEHGYWLAIAAFIVITADVFLLTINGSAFVIAYTTLSVVLGTILGTYFDYRKESKFIMQSEALLKNLDKKYLLPEVMPACNTTAEQHILNMMHEMEVSMGNNVAEYRRMNEEYKDYIETWVHEIKVPIATAEMIITNHPKEPLETLGMDDEIKRISGYVEQALFFARSETVEKDYFIKPIDLSEIVGSVIVANRKVLRSIGAGIDIHDLESTKEIPSDGKWLSFIISQIITNSIKYAKKDENLKLEIFCTENDGHVSLHIKDNGIGIKESELGRVFDKGFTGSNGRSRSASTGIGLYLCNKLCNRLQHTLSLESVENVGTDVSITF